MVELWDCSPPAAELERRLKLIGEWERLVVDFPRLPWHTALELQALGVLRFLSRKLRCLLRILAHEATQQTPHETVPRSPADPAAQSLDGSAAAYWQSRWLRPN